MSDYMTFEEAAEYLHTPHSTLYRWLREGRVPGHKLGRQWRFLRSELEAVRASGDRRQQETAALLPLARLLKKRRTKEESMGEQAIQYACQAEELIWDAADHGVSVIHLQPHDGGYALRHRVTGKLDDLAQISEPGFAALDRQLTRQSTPLRSHNKRRLYLERKSELGTERLQVRYQKLETFNGERVTLNIVPQSRLPKSIDDITNSPEDSATLRRWSRAAKGLILVSGRSGSGKTTTSFCCLDELARDRDRVIFTIEESVEFLLPNVEQIEVDLNDGKACRDAFDAVFASDLDVLFVSSSLAPKHQSTLCRHALSAAESGHLVFVQLDAVSTDNALEIFEAAVERKIEDQLVGIIWQALSRDAETGRRSAHYDFAAGPLGRTETASVAEQKA